MLDPRWEAVNDAVILHQLQQTYRDQDMFKFDSLLPDRSLCESPDVGTESSLVNELEILPTASLGAAGARELREWLAVAYAGDFAEEDWAHAIGGLHALIRDARGIVSHAAIVPRTMVCGSRPLRAGYVEAVATRSDQRRRGYANQVLRKLSEIIAGNYDFGVLSTGLHEVYAPLGWERWRGASYVQTTCERVRTAEDDDGIMVLRTLRTPVLDLGGTIVADWRSGDIW